MGRVRSFSQATRTATPGFLALSVDNGKQFHSAALLRGCQEYGVALEHRPRRQPHLGGHSERLVGTRRGAVHLLPGTTFSHGNEKGAYDSEGRAVLTLAELERWLALPIAGVYHLWKHSALGKTPLDAWQKALPSESHRFAFRRARKSSFSISCPPSRG